MRILKNHPLLKLLNSYLVDSPQPANLSYLWNFGSLLALCLVIQIITGVTLAMHYNANVIEAFDSVEHVMRDVNNGWFLRYLHSNTASAFFFIVYLHIGRGLYYGSYRAPRTLVWTIGTVIFILMMATAFLGYVLPYGQMSLWGATVITNLMSAIPWIGQDIVEFIWGGFSVNNATLNRFFALHYVLPFVLAALALMHLVALHDTAGSGNPVGVSGNIDRLAFAPYFIFKDLITIYIFIIILSVFVFFMPNALGDSENYVMANPMQTPPAIVPEWYLLPFYAILRSIPNKLLGVIAMFLAILILLALPFTDLSRSRGIQFRPLSKITFFIFLANFLILMKLGAKHVESPFIEFGQLSTIIFFSYFLIIIPFFSLFENSLLELSSLKYSSLFTNIDIRRQQCLKKLGLGSIRITLNYLMLYLLSYTITVTLVYYSCFDTFFCTYQWDICVDPDNEAKSRKTATKRKKKVVEQNKEVVDLTDKPTSKRKRKDTATNKEIVDLTEKPKSKRKKKNAAENKEVVDLTNETITRENKISRENKKIVKLTNKDRPHERTKRQRINEAKQEIRTLIKPYQEEVQKIIGYYCKAIVRHRIALSMEAGFKDAQTFDRVKASNKWKRLIHDNVTPYRILHRIRKYKHKGRAAFKKAVFHSDREIRLLRQILHSQQTLAKAGSKDCPIIPHCPYPYFLTEAFVRPKAEKDRNLVDAEKEGTDVPASSPKPKKKSRIYKKEKSPEPEIVNIPIFAEKLMQEHEKNKLLSLHLEQAHNRIQLLEYQIEKFKKPHEKKEINKKINKLFDKTTIPHGLYGDPLDFSEKNRAVMEPNRFFVTDENNNEKQDNIINSIRANPANVEPNSTFIDYTTNTVLHDSIHAPNDLTDIPPYDSFTRGNNSNLQHSRSEINSSSNRQQPRLFSPSATNFASIDSNRNVLPSRTRVSNPSPSDNNVVIDFSNVHLFPANAINESTTPRGPIRDPEWREWSDGYDSDRLKDLLRNHSKLKRMAKVRSNSGSSGSSGSSNNSSTSTSTSGDDSDSSFKSWKSHYFNDDELAARIANSQDTIKAWKVFSNVKESDIPEAIKKFNAWFNSDEEKYRLLPSNEEKAKEAERLGLASTSNDVAEANTSTSKNKKKRSTTSNVSRSKKNTTTVAEANISRNRKKKVKISDLTNTRDRASIVANARALPIPELRSSNVYNPRADTNRARTLSQKKWIESLYSKDL